MIGNCDACDRQNVPVSNCRSSSGETTQCFICQGDGNPDPYREASEMKLDLTEEWCMAAADREGNSEVGAGGMSSDFDLLIAGLWHWRNDDHADNITLTRHQIVVLLEGLKTDSTSGPHLREGGYFLTRGNKYNLRQLVGPLEVNKDSERWPWKAEVYGSYWFWGDEGLSNSRVRDIVGDEVYAWPCRGWPCVGCFVQEPRPVYGQEMPGHDETMANLEALKVRR